MIGVSCLFDIILYEHNAGKTPIDDYLNDLYNKNHKDDLIRIRTYIKQLSEHGFNLNNARPNAFSQVDKRHKIYELRPGKHRIFFIFIKGEEKFVLLHAFRKKSKKTPKKEIDRAIKEAQNYRERKQ